MKFLIAFMLLWFVVGARSARKGRGTRAITLLGTCLVLSYAYFSYRGV